MSRTGKTQNPFPKVALRANILLAFGSLVLALLAAEIFLRTRGPDLLTKFRAGKSQVMPADDPDIIYQLTPNVTFKFEVPSTINASGYRGVEGRPGRFPGFRILFIGDSIAFGWGLSDAETIPARLQDLLDQGTGTFQALNFGVPGYDIVQEAAVLERKGLAYKPDLVFVIYTLNDVGVASNRLRHVRQFQARSGMLVFRSRLVSFVADRIDRKFQSNWLKKMNTPSVYVQQFGHQIDPIPDDEVELLTLMETAPDVFPTTWYSDHYKIGRLRYGLRWLKRVADENDLRLVLVIVPRLDWERDQYRHQVAHEIVGYEAARIELEIIDMSEVLFAHDVESMRHSSKDPAHPNPEASDLIARELEEYVKKHLVATSVD